MNKIISNTNYNHFLIYFLIIDTFLLPYFYLFTIPLSLPFILLWLLFHFGSILNESQFRKYLYIFFYSLISILIGLFFFPHFLYDNVVYFIRFLYYLGSGFFLYTYFRNYSKGKQLRSLFFSIIIIFYIHVGFLAYSFYLSKFDYLLLRNIWNYRAFQFALENYLQNEITLAQFRFSHIYMDPNNLGYILSSLLLYFMFHFQFEKKFFFLLLVIPITSFSLILTQSSGTFISLFITLLVYFFYWLFNNKFIFSKLLTKFIFLFFILFVIVGSINYFLPLIEYFQDFDIVAIALNRLNSNSLDSRIEIWFYAFNNTSIYYLLYLVFFGFGGITIINGLEYSIHSGPLLLIYAYGLLPFIFLSFTMLKYFIKNKFHNYFWLIPSLIGVIINIVFGEYKIILILLILINFQYYWGIYGSFNRKKT